jgi:hypothetical protein
MVLPKGLLERVKILALGKPLHRHEVRALRLHGEEQA